jgi:hypothetical protein
MPAYEYRMIWRTSTFYSIARIQRVPSPSPRVCLGHSKLDFSFPSSARIS